MGIFDRKPNIEKMKAKKDVKGLLKALQYKEASVRAEAAKSLAEIGDERAVEPLVRALKDEDAYVRRIVAAAFRYIKDEKAFKPLIKVLEDKNEDEGARGNAALAISCQDKELKLAAIEALANALYDPSSYVRWGAAEALSSIRDVKAVKYLMKAVMDKNQNIREDILDGSSRGGYDESFLSTIKELRSSLGEEPQDCCAIARLLIPFGTSEDKFLEEEVKKVIEGSPNYAPAHYLLGFLWYRRASWSDDKKSKERYSNQALKGLQIAIKLDPKDPEPYYEIDGLPFLSFNERQRYYKQALKVDLYKSKAFGSNHWAFAMEAAKEKARGFSIDAFTRAMIVDPDRFMEGSSSVMPTAEAADGMALVWWNAAKDEVWHYQNPEDRKRLWQLTLEE